MVGEFLVADAEGVECVGAVFEEIFFRFGELLARLVLAEAVASSAHSCRLDDKDKVLRLPPKTIQENTEKLFGCNKGCKSRNSLIYTLVCGERGIQTPEADKPLSGFRVRPIRSLWHLS